MAEDGDAHDPGLQFNQDGKGDMQHAGEAHEEPKDKQAERRAQEVSRAVAIIQRQFVIAFADKAEKRFTFMCVGGTM